MQIICVSRGTYTGGANLAEKLAVNLGSDCLAREELFDAATRAGIPIGKLEMAVVRRRPLTEQLAIERERYKAFVTATLCERAVKKNLVYHGRAGHLALPGVGHVLRVRAIRDPEQRTISVMERLSLSREKARKYNEQVDEDRQRWVRTLYNVDCQNPEHYDAVVNLSQLSVDNAAVALVSLAQLPEFQITPATCRVLEDLLLSAQCRLAIGADQRTRGMNVHVRAEHGRVFATFLPRQERSAQYIPQVLKTIDGVDEILCTMASTNLLWIQERYDPRGQSLPQVLEIAARWNAAVELVQLVEGGQQEDRPAAETAVAAETGMAEAEKHCGILDDAAGEDEASQDEGLKQIRQRLITAGRAGGYRAVAGGAKELLDSLDRTAPYSLVVVGDVFLSKSESARKRLSREMVGYLGDNLRVPVIGTDELKTQYLFGPARWAKLIVFAALAFGLLLLVYTYQKEALTFLSREGTGNRILSTAALLAFVPVFAYIYGNFTRNLLRLFKFE